jgi:hypothetical protein
MQVGIHLAGLDQAVEVGTLNEDIAWRNNQSPGLFFYKDSISY